MTDTVKIRVEADTRQAQSELKKVRNETDKASASTEDFQKALSNIHPALGRASQAFFKLRDSFKGFRTSMESIKTEKLKGMSTDMGKMKGSMGGVGNAAKTMAVSVSSAFSALSSSIGAVLSSFNPILLALAAIAAAALVLKKAWDIAKAGFKAWDPTGYAKTFGTLQREIRKLMTAIGALTSGAVKEIMYVVIGIVRWLRQGIEILVKIKSWVDGIVDSLGGAFDIIMNAVTILGGVFGVVFKIASDTGKQAAEEVGEVWSEEMSVGLASFDKLNNIGMEYGDAEEREDLLKDLEVATTEGKSIFDSIAEGLSKVLDVFGGVSDWLGGLWKGFHRCRSLMGQFHRFGWRGLGQYH